MKRCIMPTIRDAIGLTLLALLDACGGGGSTSGPPPPPPPPPALTITTGSNLPGTLINAAYSVTLQAVNGVGSVERSIQPACAGCTRSFLFSAIGGRKRHRKCGLEHVQR